MRAWYSLHLLAAIRQCCVIVIGLLAACLGRLCHLLEQARMLKHAAMVRNQEVSLHRTSSGDVNCECLLVLVNGAPIVKDAAHS